MLWATIPLAVSAVGISGLLALKALEIRRGMPFFGHARQRLDAKTVQLLSVLQRDVPERIRAIASDVMHHLAVQLTSLALLVIRFAERRLTRFVDMVKGRRELKQGNGTRSAYLRDVTSHRDEVRRINGYHPNKK